MMMKHWQFLIQKQGDRTWHPLESATNSFVEGKYRIVARSHLVNTPAEVRVSYISSVEMAAEPVTKPVVQRRSRSTNGEGLIAVIPFTYFKPGSWTIQCSGNIMSDLLGKSWYYGVSLHVLSKDANKVTDDVNNLIDEQQFQTVSSVSSSDNGNSESNVSKICNSSDIEEKVETTAGQTTQKELESADSESQVSLQGIQKQTRELIRDKLAEEKLEEDIRENNQENIDSFDTLDAFLPTSSTISNPVVERIKSPEIIEEKISNSQENISKITGIDNLVTQEEKGKQVASEKVQLDESLDLDILPQTSRKNTPINDIDQISKVMESGENIEKSETVNISETGQDSEVKDHNTSDTDNSTPSLNSEEKNSENYIPDELIVVPQSTRAITLKELESEEHAIIDAPANPVWLQDESAEQILQNLVELALPSTDSLISEEPDNNQPVDVSPSLPISIILEKPNYITHWGESFAINGLVKFNEDNYYELGEAYDFESIFAGELILEFSSPDDVNVLEKFTKSLPEKLLPFDFDFSALVPENFESKLILAKISLYGVLSGIGEPELLAEQSFTITAELGELLAIAKTTRFVEMSLDRENNTSSTVVKEKSAVDTISPPESSTNLDLQLFNLVKTAKYLNQSSQTKVAKSPELPNLDENSNQVFRKSLNPLENLRITPKKVADSTLPYLKKLPSLTPHQENDNDTPQPREIFDDLDSLDDLDNLELTNLDYPPVKTAIKFDYDESSLLRRVTTEPAMTGIPRLDRNPQILEEEDKDSCLSTVKASNLNLIKESLQENPVELPLESTVVDSPKLPTANPYPSPLIRQWLESQGHSLPPVETPEYEGYISTDQYLPQSETFIYNSNIIESEVYEDSNSVSIEMDTKLSNTSNSGDFPEFNSSVNMSLSETNSQIQPHIQTYSESSWLSNEIVVDELPEDLEENSSRISTNANDTSNLDWDDKKQSSALVIQGSRDLVSTSSLQYDEYSREQESVQLQTLPVPELYIPNIELVSGKTIRVKVQLEAVDIPIAIKFWVEDTQTRWLLFGPQLLTNLLPNLQGKLETVTQLSIPFGCVEVRLEAIAMDLLTEQESHKISIMRNVVPPNLPAVKMDEILGI